MVVATMGGIASIPLGFYMAAVALQLVLAAEFAQYLFLTVYRVGETSPRQAIIPYFGGLFGGALVELIGVPMTLVVGMLGMLLAVVHEDAAGRIRTGHRPPGPFLCTAFPKHGASPT
jgi:hypothetical protein